MKNKIKPFWDKVAKNPLEAFIILFALAAVFFILWVGNEWCRGTKGTDILSFLIIAITLAALVYYARDTHRIADLQEKKWMLEIQPRAGYQMEQDSANPSKTIFWLMNYSDFILEVRVWCNFLVYNMPTKSTDLSFEGERVWDVYPNQGTFSYFEIEPIIQTKGYSMEKMLEERTENNRQIQLTMDLKIEFTSDTKQTRTYPERHHFFDFESKRWVPHVTKPLASARF